VSQEKIELVDNERVFVPKSLYVVMGFEEALVLSSVHYQLCFNRAHKVNEYEGTFWYFTSWAKWSEWQKDLLSEGQVRRCFENLIDGGWLFKHAKGFNRMGYDKTSWYTWGPKCLESRLFTDSSKSANGLVETDEPIHSPSEPDSSLKETTAKKPINDKTQTANNPVASPTPELAELLEIWPHPVKDVKPVERAWLYAVNKLGVKPSLILDVGRKWANNSWQHGLLNWLKGKMWEKPPQPANRNGQNNSYTPRGGVGGAQSAQVPSQIDKRLLMLTNRYAKIPPRLWRELQNESEEVLDYLNRNSQITNGATAAECKAKAKEYLRSQISSVDIFSEMLKKPVDNQ